MTDRFAELRGYGCVISAAAEKTACDICAQLDTPLGIFAASGRDEEVLDDEGAHLVMMTDDAYLTVCIDANGSTLLCRSSSDGAFSEGMLDNVSAAVQFFRDHQTPSNQ